MSKRNRDEQSLGDALKSFFKGSRLEKGMDNMAVRDAWNNMMGNAIAGYTKDIRLQNGTLYVRLTSSVLREELSYGKQKIADMLNRELGQDLVQKVVLQ